jgi:2,4-dienoyl-CoA reductase-like NADH-dependent reductase (Old Yellow Enzyme family)
MKNEVAAPLRFACGANMKNRFMLAPMTNTQSHEDGRLSDEEFHWLSMRAKGQFGLVMTCASHVQAIGQGFPGQLGIFGDQHIEGHTRLASAIKKEGSLAVVQLHHAGMRSPADLIGEAPVCPSPKEKYGARGLSPEEVHQLRADFIDAAVRAQKSGYDGVEVHGAHGYILTQFLSEAINQRADEYGGNLENRARLLFEVVNGIRAACGREFLLGVRLSPERFGMKLQEIKDICHRLIREGNIDFLDLSLWDSFKLPEEKAFQHKTLLEHFAELDYQQVRWTVAGKIKSGADVRKVMDAGVDFVSIGRSAILHHDFPVKVMKDPDFVPASTPVSITYLQEEGLSERFIDYMRRWPNFVQ